MKLSENIKHLRKQKNLCQEQLAEVMNVSTASVSKWETGQCAPELTVLMELADFFEVSMDTLVGHELSSDRMESLICQMEKAVKEREEETAVLLYEKILRNYPNNPRAVKACADSYYQLFIYTSKNFYMESCISQTKRLMSLKQGEPEKETLERLFYLGNQYSFLEQWDIAKKYYEQSNVRGKNNTSIAECLMKQGELREAVELLSDGIIESVFHVYQTINLLVDGWISLGESQKACTALEWLYHVMEPLRYNITIMLLIQMKLVELYEKCEQFELAQTACRKAAELVKENRGQEFLSAVDFLQIKQERKLLISAPENNKELLQNIASKMGACYETIVKEVLE